jgi:hypothetical protein
MNFIRIAILALCSAVGFSPTVSASSLEGAGLEIAVYVSDKNAHSIKNTIYRCNLSLLTFIIIL